MKKIRNFSKRQLSGLVGQWVGMIAVVIGIVIEIQLGAHLGFVLITAGALVYAIATKLVNFQEEEMVEKKELPKWGWLVIGSVIGTVVSLTIREIWAKIKERV